MEIQTESKLSQFKNKLFDNLFEFIHKFKYFVVLFWIILSIISAFFAFDTFQLTTTNFDAPKGSLAEKSNELYETLYPTHNDYEMTVIVTVREDGGEINTPEYHNFINELNKTINNHNPQLVLNIYSEMSVEVNITKYLSENDTAVMIVNSNSEDTADMVRDINKQIKIINPVGYRTKVSGNVAGSLETSQIMIKDMKKMEGVMLPIVILIFLYVVRNIVLMVIPLMNLIIIFLTTFASIYPIAKFSVYFSVSPCVNLTLAVAMSVDYSLFLLSRFSEELRKKQSYTEAVKLMFRHSGRIIVTSGFVLICSFASCCFYNVNVVRTLGMGCILTLFFTVFVNVTVTPSMLLIFPKFFSLKGLIPCSEKCKKSSDNVGSSFWHYQAKWMAKPKNSWTVLFIGIALLMPFIICLKDFEMVMDLTQCFSREADAITALPDITKVMPSGIINPYKLMVHSHPDEEVSFQYVEDFANNLTHWIGKEHMVCYNYFDGKVIPQKMVKLLKRNDYYNAFYNKFSNETSNSFLCLLLGNNLDEIQDIVDSTNVLIQDLEKKYNVKADLVGGSVNMVALIEEVLDFFPIQILILTVTVLLLIFATFQSVVMSIRVVFTTCLTLFWVFGLASIVFNTHIFFDAGLVSGKAKTESSTIP